MVRNKISQLVITYFFLIYTVHKIPAHSYISFVHINLLIIVIFVTAKNLVTYYRTILPERCCPLLRLEDLYIDRSVIDLYLQPKITVQQYRDHYEITNSPLSGLDCITDIIGQTEPGTRIILIGSGGVGKSAFSSHITREWCNGQTLNKCQFLYLLLPRYIDCHKNPLEQLMCEDLNFHNSAASGELRRLIKCNSENIYFLIDGYDEISDREQRYSSLNKVISGEIAQSSTVVITTREHCARHLISLCHGNYVKVLLSGLTRASSEEYIKRMSTPGTKVDVQQMLYNVPEEAMHIPLLLNMIVLIDRWNEQSTAKEKPFLQTRTVSAIIGRIIGMYIAMRTEKEDGTESLPLFESPVDDNVPIVIRQQMYLFAKMCFAAVREKQFVFKSDTLKQFHFFDKNCLSKLGFLEITFNAEGDVESARCAHNQLLEYFAGLHVAEDKEALQSLINLFSKADHDKNMSDNLGFWQDTLLFAVGIRPSILSNISNNDFTLRVLCNDKEKMQKCLDLSYEARLLHEAQSSDVQEVFCKSLMTAPLYSTTTSEVRTWYCPII